MNSRVYRRSGRPRARSSRDRPAPMDLTPSPRRAQFRAPGLRLTRLVCLFRLRTRSTRRCSATAPSEIVAHVGTNAVASSKARRARPFPLPLSTQRRGCRYGPGRTLALTPCEAPRLRVRVPSTSLVEGGRAQSASAPGASASRAHGAACSRSGRLLSPSSLARYPAQSSAPATVAFGVAGALQLPRPLVLRERGRACTRR